MNLGGPLDAKKLADTILLYVNNMAFTASCLFLFCKGGSYFLRYTICYTTSCSYKLGLNFINFKVFTNNCFLLFPDSVVFKLIYFCEANYPWFNVISICIIWMVFKNSNVQISFFNVKLNILYKKVKTKSSTIGHGISHEKIH